MQLARIKNTKENILYGLLNKSIAIIFQFIIRMVVIYELGEKYLGLNSLFSSILQVLNLSELGFSNAVVQCMYSPIAKDDTKKVCNFLNFIRKVYKYIGLVILGVGVGIIPFLRYLINDTYPDGINIYIIYMLYLLNTAVSYFLFSYKNVILFAFQQNSLISNVSSLSQTLLAVIQLIILIKCQNYYLVTLVLPVTTILNNLGISYLVDKKYSQYKCSGNLEKKEKQELFTKVKGLMLYKVCGTSRNAFDSIFISAFLGLTVTAKYGNYFYVITALTAITSVITSSMLAGVGNSLELDSKEKNYQDMKRFDFMYMLICGWMAICLLCLYQPFIKICFGKDMLLPRNVSYLFVLYFYELKMGDVRATYADAVGLWWENRYRTIIEAILNLILNYLLVQIWGIYGVLIATIVSLFFMGYLGAALVLYKNFFTMESIWEYLRNHCIYLVVTGFVAYITYWICMRISIFDIQGFFIRICVCLIVPSILYWIIYCKTKRYHDAKEWLLSAARK